MSMVINTNTASLVAQAAQAKTSSAMDTAMERLSTGKRINSAADDAAGLAITNRMESQVAGIAQALRNAADGQALIDTAEGAHEEVTNILQRMRELAVQSANDTNTAEDRAMLQKEVNQLIAEIDRISGQTTYNGEALLDGSFTAKKLQIGADAGQNVTFDVSSVASSAIGNHSKSSLVNVASGTANGILAAADMVLSGKLGSVTIDTSANQTAKSFAAAVNAVTSSTGVSATAVTKVKLGTLSATGSVGMTINGTAIASTTLSSTSDLRTLRDNINAISGTTGVTAAIGSSNAEIVLTDADGDDIKIGSFDHSVNGEGLTVTALDQDGVAAVQGDGSTALGSVRLKDTTFTTSGTAENTAFTIAGQVRLNSSNSFTMVTTETTVVDATTDGGNTTTADTLVSHGEFFGTDAGSAADVSLTSSQSNIASVNIGTQTGANNAIKAIDGAIIGIAQERATLGALSNRLDNTINNLTNVKVNTEASKSRIQDADFAAETSNLTKSQILSQAATAMLAQANASKQSVLSLLQG